MSDLLELSGRLGSMTNLVHGFIYFAPEASEGFDALGLPADHHYFASRGAALGPVSAEVIVATFYNCLLYTSPSPRDRSLSRMPSSA